MTNRMKHGRGRLLEVTMTPVPARPEGAREMTYSFTDARKRRYEKALADVVQGLRDLADEVERTGKPKGPPAEADGARYAVAAGDLINQVVWKVANLNLGRLAFAAAEIMSSERADTEEKKS